MLGNRILICIFVLLAIVIVGWTTSSVAYEQGDWIIRGGAINVDPSKKSDSIDIASLTTLSGVEADNDTQLGVSGTYLLTDTWALELLAVTPFKPSLSIKGADITAGSTKVLPPTLTLAWYPKGGKNVDWQPYVGVGINYTHFWDEKINVELETALGMITEPVTGSTDAVSATLDLDDSWGFAAHAGFDYLINDKWGINAAVWYIQIETKATIGTGIADVKFNAKLDPWVYMAGINYRF